MKFVYAKGATPFNESDAAHLIPKHIKTQQTLNEWEQANIVIAERWLFSRKRKNLLTLEFIQTLHQKMFDKTWVWAGQFRRHQTSIGIEPYLIPTALKILCDDVRFWLQKQTYPLDEIAVRFHHRLVQIHAFSNGNGRHARLLTDALLAQQRHPRFTWGKEDLVSPSKTRKQYIEALRYADQGEYSYLAHFVRK